MKQRKRVVFLCVHNSCRSQIAEALGKHLASDVFESASAGTQVKDRINPDAVRLMKQMYGIDMEATQKPKLFSQLPEPDMVISMGCEVGCPYIGRELDDNWQLQDPTGKEDAVFLQTIMRKEPIHFALGKTEMLRIGSIHDGNNIQVIQSGKNRLFADPQTTGDHGKFQSIVCL